MPGLELSEAQRKAAATAITVLAVTVIVCAVGALFWLLAEFLQRFSHVFLPLAVAGVIALVLNPYFEWLRGPGRLPGPVAVAVVFLSILLPVVAFLWFFGALIAEQISDLVSRLPDLWQRLVAQVQERWPDIQEFFQEHELGQRIQAAAQEQGDAIAQGLQYLGEKMVSAGAGFLGAVGTFLAWAVLPVYLVFFLLAESRDFGRIEDHLPFLKSETRRDVAFLVREFIRIVVAFFRGQLIVALIQGLLFAIGFTIVDLRYGFVLGLMLGVLNIIPYLGSIVGLAIALPLAFFQEGGGWWLVVAVLVVFTAVQMIEGYILTPKIMGDRTGLHPMAVIVAIFFWGSALGGILGMILAIPLTAFLVVLWRLARERYIGEWI